MKWLILLSLAVTVVHGEAAIACGAGSRADRAAWAEEHQRTLDSLHRVSGIYRETSRQDGPEDENGMITTSVKGQIVTKQGKVIANVIFFQWNDLGVCRWTKHPFDGQQGKFYLEKKKNDMRELVHFEERRKK